MYNLHLFTFVYSQKFHCASTNCVSCRVSSEEKRYSVLLTLQSPASASHGHNVHDNKSNTVSRNGSLYH